MESLVPKVVDDLTASFRLRSWGREVSAEKIGENDVKELTSYVKNCADIDDNISLLNLEKTDQLVKKTIFRKRFYYSILPLTLITLLASIVLLIIWIETSSVKYFLFGGFALSLFVIELLSLRSISLDKRKLKLEDFLNEKLTHSQKTTVVQLIHQLRSGYTRLYYSGNYDIFLYVTPLAISAENWFLLFSDNERDRRGIWLDGRYPPGDLFIENPTEKELTRNVRVFDIQRTLLISSKSAKILYKKLTEIYPKGSKLNVERQARFNTIEYISKNPEFWDNIRNNKCSIDDDIIAAHKQELSKIFIPASRKHITLEGKDVPKMMYEFVDLKDRTLETWFRELEF